ncbi:MAG: nucleoside-diphosphate kinase [Candidatus Pristimantibacillus lignocellulolyticus]|uniref:Nucleoside diphosphate kinase n=1 Tax=Candidatus Pristimantibacillus lignocellulolyticus TaxID=2994561 RepID=A0A9J6ZJJ3_9BACL|nr:MAG: nucleoside-diphosphate kinase [Candidatus Pristimantibacillus lignocellulolyticus]
MEQTFVMIKPDGVKLGLIGTIIQRFENKRLRLVRSDLRSLTVEQAREHYCDLAQKPFFEELVTFITSGEVVAMVWEGPAAIKVARNLIGATNPVESLPGTIRGDFALELKSNIIHGSDSAESAVREISLFFPLLSEKQAAVNSIAKVV